METKTNQEIGFFEKYLTLWVVICMIAGVLILGVAGSFIKDRKKEA